MDVDTKYHTCATCGMERNSLAFTYHNGKVMCHRCLFRSKMVEAFNKEKSITKQIVEPVRSIGNLWDSDPKSETKSIICRNPSLPPIEDHDYLWKLKQIQDMLKQNGVDALKVSKSESKPKPEENTGERIIIFDEE